MHFHWLVLTACFAGAALAASDETDPYSAYRNQNDYDASLAVPWIEQEITLEALPKDASLSQFAISKMPANISLYGDLSRLVIDDDDKVSRLWLVAKSKQGAYNGTYEGFRCATGEYKVYAYINPKHHQTLRKVPLSRWQSIKRGSYRSELARDYLCRGTLPRPPQEVIQRLDRSPADYEPPY